MDLLIDYFICSWYAALDSSKWMYNLSSLLYASKHVADTLSRQPVLVHCSDGWDRTPQLVSLAQLILDPHYRTFKVSLYCTLSSHVSINKPRELQLSVASLNCELDEKYQWCELTHEWLKSIQLLITGIAICTQCVCTQCHTHPSLDTFVSWMLVDNFQPLWRRY